MHKIQKSQVLLLSMLVIIAISGCVGNTPSPTPTSTPVPTVNPKPAYDAITQAQSTYQTIQSDFSKTSASVNEAISRGVETTNSSALLSSFQSKISNAANLLDNALSLYQT